MNPTDCFHDYCIRSISVYGIACHYSLKSNVIRVELSLYEKEIFIEFFNVSYLKLLNENKDSYWVNVPKYIQSNKPIIGGLEEIVLCEFGIIAKSVFKFAVLTSSSAIFLTHFEKVKLKTLCRRN